MYIFYTDHFVLPLPDAHRFPMSKYRLLRERVADAELIPTDCLRVPDAATDEQILLAHDAAYLQRVKEGSLTQAEVRRMGFPWSSQLVERSRRSCGATIAACQAALKDGCAVNLAGGTHHAFRDAGEGYCVFNDSAIAARVLQEERKVATVAILDCDVHQGNGTAAILADDPTVLTLSIHGARNFPSRKVPSDIDIALEDGTDDSTYLAALERGLQHALTSFKADLAIYLAGADPFEGDRFGRLNLTKKGLADRDRLVLDYCRKNNIPVAVTMAGGYAPNVDDIVDIHSQTVREAVRCANSTTDREA